MSDKRKASAWESMTDQQKVEWIAEEVMEWERSPSWEYGVVDPDYSLPFEPLGNWNHWRQVEEKVMGDNELDDAYFAHVMNTNEYFPKVGLATRARALYLAFQSLR